MKRILLLGASGQVGFEVYQRLSSYQDVNLLAVTSPSSVPRIGLSVDLTDSKSAVTLVRSFRPEVIINAAAYTSVPGAEIDRAKAIALNTELPAALAAEAVKTRSILIHYSSEFVYPGEGSAPMDEKAETRPLNAYGETKLLGDEAIQASGCMHLILRTSWVYSNYRQNFLKAIYGALLAGTPIQVVDDEIGSPTSARSLASATLKLALRRDLGVILTAHGGLYHYADEGALSRLDFAKLIRDTAEDLRIIPAGTIIDRADNLSAVARPKNSRLATGRFQNVFDLQPPPVKAEVASALAKLAFAARAS